MIRPRGPDGRPLSPRAARLRAAERKAKRRSKGVALGLRPAPIPDLRGDASRGRLKARIVTWLGELDRLTHGDSCRIHGTHPGEVAYHLVPQVRGEAAAFLPENVVWACRGANYGEFRHRKEFREKHVEIFGAERVERMEEIAGSFSDFSLADLWRKYHEVRALAAAAALRKAQGAI